MPENQAPPLTEDQREQLVRRPLRFYFRLKRRPAFIGIVALMFTNALDALPPLLIGMAVDQIADGKAGYEVLKTLGLLFAISMGLIVFRYIWRVQWGQFHNNVAFDLRHRIFHRLSVLGPSFYQKNPVGQLMSLITNDVNSFRHGIGPGVLVVLDGLMMSAFVLPLMFYLSVSWTWKTLILMPLVPVIINRVTKVIHDRYRVQQDRFSEMSGQTQEIISGIRVIKSFAQEATQTRIFNLFSRRFEESCNRVMRVDSAFHPIMELGVSVGSVILLIVGAPEVISGAMSIGAFLAFYQYIQRMIWPMTALGMGLSFIQQGRASFERIAEVLSETPDLCDNGEKGLDHFDSLEVKNLSFAYPGEGKPTLKNIGFRLEAGQTLGVLGVTGAGKSTLLEALCQLYPLPKKTVFLNGHPIEDYRLSEVRRNISLIPQEPFLFSDKIVDNIAVEGQSRHEEVMRMAELVNIDKEIDETPDGYDTYLGERGVNLSGGQKQRLTIARALLRKSPLVLFDDSLSAVDAKTEARILRELQRKSQSSSRSGMSSIIVSHRVASIQWADQILVLNDGEVEACGCHKDLLKTSSTYKRIFDLQNEGDIYES